MASLNSASSNALSVTRVVSSNSRVSTTRSICGSSRAWDQPAAACNPDRAATAAATTMSDGMAARTRP